MRSAAILEGGFTDPVMDAQSAFRAVMHAMAEPGTVQPLQPALTAPAPLASAVAAMICTLCDADTPVWLDTDMAQSSDVYGWIEFHTGAPVVASSGEARFCTLAGVETLLPLDRFATGTDAYPDRSATLLAAAPTFETGPFWRMTGPGVSGERVRQLAGLDETFAKAWRANGALFPRGVDVVLAGPEGVLALPRTVQLTLRGD